MRAAPSSPWHLILLTGFLVAGPACAPFLSAAPPDSDCAPGRRLLIAPNDRYGARVELCGDPRQPEYDWEVEAVFVRDRHGRRGQFAAGDPISLEQSSVYFKEVWSPDGEFLVLPLGRFQGFAVYPARTAVEAIQTEGGARQLRLVDPLEVGYTALWHAFVGWHGPHLLDFVAGMSGEKVRFVADVSSGQVYSTSPEPFEVLASGGRQKILVDRR
jgi:hypothetical protein